MVKGQMASLGVFSETNSKFYHMDITNINIPYYLFRVFSSKTAKNLAVFVVPPPLSPIPL